MIQKPSSLLAVYLMVLVALCGATLVMLAHNL